MTIYKIFSKMLSVKPLVTQKIALMSTENMKICVQVTANLKTLLDTAVVGTLLAVMAVMAVESATS